MGDEEEEYLVEVLFDEGLAELEGLVVEQHRLDPREEHFRALFRRESNVQLGVRERGLYLGV
ncbi:hypothetical protein GCM10009021_22230 [Halarchaeum nitratireducens]|uniref:Uncharacterized protein n=1 Tax=Halarchaeum nitratireducens TaxID=489913 RepID=A0A830GDD8_9EURY|nr:hypothetical protein GCM10009021_22230 [Halarchaeum nitratireducens]